jgi:muramoyltetrapeptide carboxypeptidase LdcA involved in peptidoglycan recycling
VRTKSNPPDKEVEGIFCLTGGWGASRILPYLDYPLIRENPIALIGFSDITSLLNGNYAQTSLLTFHGPVADTEFLPYSLDSFKRLVMDAEKDILIGSPLPYKLSEGRVQREIGKFTDCLPSPHQATQFTLENILPEFVRRFNVPAVSGLMIGHIEEQSTLPIGCIAELNGNIETLQLQEAAVF